MEITTARSDWINQPLVSERTAAIAAYLPSAAARRLKPAGWTS